MSGVPEDCTDDPSVEPFRADRILESMSDAFVALDARWRYTYVNAEAGRLFGRRPEDLVGRHIWTEFPEGVGQTFHAMYERAMATQQPVIFDDFYPPWNRWFENRVFPSPQGLLIFFHEITARKSAEALLAGQAQLLEMIAAGAALPSTLEALVRLMEQHAPGMLGSVLLLDEDGRHVRHGAAPSLPASFVRGVDGQPIGPRAGSCGTAAYLKAPVFVEDIAIDPLWDDYRALALEHGLRAGWSSPIFDREGRVIGTFALYYAEPRLPDAAHRRLIELATHTAAIAICRDRIDRAMRHSEEQLRLAVDAAHVGTFDWDLRHNRIVWSKWHHRLWGIEPGGFAGTYEAFAERVHRDDLPAIEAEVARCIAAREPFEREFRVVLPDGGERRIHGRGEFTFDDNGRAERMVGAVVDVTARWRIEQALRRQSALLDQSYDAVFAYELEGPIIYWNRGAERLYGLPASSAIGSSAPRLLHTVFPRSLRDCADALARDGVWEGELLQRTAGGRRVRVECRMSLILYGREVLVLEANRDITARTDALRALEESRERLRQLAGSLISARENERARLAREIHDELGQQLTALKMDLAWLARRIPEGAGVGPKIDQMSELIDESIQAVRRVATDLRPAALDDLGLAAALESHAREFKSRSGIECRLAVDVDERRMTPQIAITLFRIVQEALTNVARHAQASKVSVSLSCDADEFVLEVRDDGRGIPADEISSPKSIGVSGMRERAETAGGAFAIRGSARGTIVSVRLPAPQPADVA